MPDETRKIRQNRFHCKDGRRIDITHEIGGTMLIQTIDYNPVMQVVDEVTVRDLGEVVRLYNWLNEIISEELP